MDSILVSIKCACMLEVSTGSSLQGGCFNATYQGKVTSVPLAALPTRGTRLLQLKLSAFLFGDLGFYLKALLGNRLRSIAYLKSRFRIGCFLINIHEGFVSI